MQFFKKQKRTYATFLFCVFGTIAYSQSVVKGLVQDSKSGRPLVGASVVDKVSGSGAITSDNGEFILSTATKGEIYLIINLIGYEPEEVLATTSTMLIVLTEKDSDLDEVVVTALNQKRVARDLGYTVQKLESKDLTEVKSPNFVDNLAGKVAGVTISQGATGVGSSSKITIRGEASFTNNNPLFIVDGMPINNNTTFNFTDAAAAGFQEIDFGNGAMAVNPDDVESVSVLKGPAAAALYGTRAANGVIIINTKTGDKSKGVGVSFNSTTMVESPFALPKFQNEYGQGNSGQFSYVDGSGGGVNDNISYSWGPRLDQGTMIAQFNSPVTRADGSVVRGGDIALYSGDTITPTAFVSNPDNLKNFYKTGLTTVNNIAVSSGFDKGSVRVSLTDMQSESYIPGVNLDRRTLAAHLNLKPTEKLEVNTSFNYINSQSDNRPSNGYGSENINYSLVAWGPRSLDIASMEDYWQPGLENEQQYSFNYSFFDNPYFVLFENRNSFNRNRLFGNVSARYMFTDKLSLSVASGVDLSSESRQFRRHFSTNRFKTGAYAEQDLFYKEVNTNFLLTYSEADNKLVGYEVSFGGNRLDQNAVNKQSQTLSLAQPGIFNFSNSASPIEISQFSSQRRINSFYGLAKFRYKRFLYLDITGRNDWSSSLATATSTSNTSFFYPSASMSYIASEVFNLPKWIGFAKLRASIAQVGNDADPYQTSGVYAASVPVDGQPTFTQQNSLPNTNLLPERTSAIELGGDVRLFNNRLKVDITYYNAITRNQIVSLPIVASSGYEQQVVNGGAVRSKGLEAILQVTNVRREDFSWNTTFNFSRNISTVEELPEGTDRITLGTSSIYDNVNQTVWFQVEEGGRIGDMYGTGYLRNENGAFVIDDDGNFIADNNLQKLGNYNPDFILGIGNSLRYKNFDLSFLFDWRQGGVLVSRTLALAGVGGQLEETADRPDAGIVADGEVNVGSDENPVWQQNTTAISAERYYRQYYDRNHEENNTYNASYIKLRQFSLGYTFNSDKEQGVLKKGRELRVAFIGRNVFAFSNIPHFDPEQLAVQGNQFISGVEDMSYPTARSLGVKIGYNF
jgi:TonB-linked SusC/RagA family outer membrane protein